MTREEVADKIRWSVIFWVVGFVNIGAMLPQLIKIIQTQSVKGLALGMFVIYFLTQVAFSLDGYFKRNRTLMICMGVSSLVSLTIIFLILYFRR